MSQNAPHPIQDWPQQYDRILNSYATHPSEELMQQASDLGHALFDAGVPPEDVVAEHMASVGRMCAGATPRCSDRMAAVTPPFLELMMAYGIGYRRQKSLIEQLGERTVELEETITQRERAEEALQLTQFTVDHMSDAVFWMDSRGKFFSVNETACKNLGYSQDELLRLSVHDIDPDYPQGRFDQLWKACLDRDPVTIESHHRRTDGQVFPVEITVNRMEYNGRAFLCALVRDVTERKQAQDALRRAHDELEIRVEERTAELKAINARLEREIEVRKCTEASLRRREEELELITDSTPAFIAYVDSNQRYQFVNMHYEKFFRRPKSEIIGHTVEEILGSPNYASIRKYIDLALAGRRVNYQPTLENPDGRSLHTISTYVPDFDKDGKVKGFNALIIDISARVDAEAKLRLKTTQLATITDAITSFLKTGNWREACATILRGAKNQTESEYAFIGVVADGAALHILAFEGIKWDAVKGRKLYEDAVRDFQQAGYLAFSNFENLFGAVITKKRTVISNDPSTDPRSAGLPSGHPALRHFLGVPILSGTEVVGMIGLANRPGGFTHSERDKIEILCRAAGVLLDSYQRRQREVAMEQERAQAEESIRMKEAELAHVARLSTLGEMAGGLAHELNQPLAAIASYASASLNSARTGSSDPNIYCDDMTRICEQVERAGGIIRRLRRFVRRSDPRQSTVNINQAIQEVLKLIETETRHENVRILLELADEELEVCADNIQIQQVMLNLVRNGIEAMHSIPHEIRQIVIRSSKTTDNCVEVTVFDNGSGFSDEMSENLFQPFFTTKERGLGLGLSISRSIIEAHGGRLWATSDESRGATFHLSLPLIRKESIS